MAPRRHRTTATSLQAQGGWWCYLPGPSAPAMMRAGRPPCIYAPRIYGGPWRRRLDANHHILSRNHASPHHYLARPRHLFFFFFFFPIDLIHTS